MGGLVLAQASGTSSGVGAGVAVFFFLVGVAAYLFYGYCLGRIFQKAGQPLWAGFVPFYNTYIMLKVVGRPGWWLILFFIPVINFVIAIIVYLDMAKSFGRGVGFALGLFFLSFIFVPILALNDASYLGPAAGPGGPPAGYPPPGYPMQGGGQWNPPR